MERLEERTLLSGPPDNLAQFELSWGDAVFEDVGNPGSSGKEWTASPIMDLGDFYWAGDQRIHLHRKTDEVVVAFEPSADRDSVITRLGNFDGNLQGFSLTHELGDGIAFFLTERDVPPATYDALAADPDVAWAMPLLVSADTGRWIVPTNQVVVNLKPGVAPADFFGAEFSRFEPLFTSQWIGTLAKGGGLAAIEVANRLTGDPRVQWATPNTFQDWQLFSHDPPSDPLYGSQWHLNNTGQTGARLDADSDLAEVWDTTTGNDNVVIAVLDSGVQTSHPDLNIFVNPGEITGNGIDDDSNGFIDDVNGWDFYSFPLGGSDNDPSPSPDDALDNHGTAVAGVAGAWGDNLVGVTGASQQVRVLPVKIANGGGFAASSTIAKAIYYAAGAVLDAMGEVVGRWRGADILNASWGGGMPDAMLTAAFDWATSSGRNGLGAAAFVASGNSAAGATPALRQYLPIAVPPADLSGFAPANWSWVLAYSTDGNPPTGVGNEDALRLAQFQNDDGTISRFDTLDPPPGWLLEPFVAQDGWFIEDNPARAFGASRYQARAASIGNNDKAYIMAPPIAVNAGNPSMSAELWVWQSSNPDDKLEVRLWNHATGQLFSYATLGGVIPDVKSDVDYPANLPSTIAVGASTDWDYRSAYSQFGSSLDFVAPSGGGFAGITTTDRTGTDGYNAASGTAGDYTSTPDSAFSGTSSASPLAAGIAALMLSRNPTLTAAEIRTAMRNTADKIGGNNGSTAYDVNGFNQYYGFGRVNAADAVAAISPDTTAPTVLSLTPSAGTIANFGSTLTVDVEFSEPVVGVDDTDLVVAGLGVSVASVAQVPGMMNTHVYRFVLNTPNDSIIKLMLAPDPGDITDIFGNPLLPLSWTYWRDNRVARPPAPDLDASSDTGRSISAASALDPVIQSNMDNITKNSTLAFVGVVSPNASVELFEGTGSLGTTTASPTGVWSLTPTLSAGLHTVFIRVNGGPDSPTLTVTVDTAIGQPAAPDLVDGSDTGTSQTDNVTSDTTPTFSGAAGSVEANSTVELLEDTSAGTVLHGRTIASGTGSWSITAGELAAGVHALYVRATDPAGNVSVASAALTMTVDTTTIQPPAPDLHFASDTGRSITDNITSDATPAFHDVRGSVSAGAAVELREGADTLASTTADATGRWSLETGTLAPGAHTVYVRTGGFDSPPLTITIDTTVSTPSSPPDLDPSSDRGTSPTDDITNDSTPHFSGSAGSVEGSAGVQLYEGTTLLGNTTAAADGSWSIMTGTVSSTAHTIYMKVIDPAGNVSGNSPSVMITVDTTRPSAPGPVDLATASDTGTSNSDEITSATTPTFTWTAATDNSGGSGIGGYWWAVDDPTPETLGTLITALTATPTVASGAHTFYVRTTDVAGNVHGGAAISLAFTVDTTPPKISAPGVAIKGTNPLDGNDGQGNYIVPVGSGAQLQTVPVGGANKITITFTEEVAVTQADLTLRRTIPNPDTEHPSTGFEPTTTTAEWTFATFPADKMELTLSDAVMDIAGNRLDGEWTNPGSLADTGTSNYPSGNGTAQGNFVFRFTILPGDANQDLVVDILDYNIFLPKYQQGTGTKFVEGDFDGSGQVKGTDYNAYLKPNFLKIWVFWDVEYVLGDMDVDRDVDFDDIAPFVLALSNPAAYMAQYGVDPNLVGDWDGDGDLDFDDISEFVAWFSPGGLIPASLPEDPPPP